MPQYDTGLGWSAKSEWLMSTTGEVSRIGIIGGPDYPGQPLPKNLNTALDVKNGGMYLEHKVFTSSWYADSWYASANDSDILVARITDSSWIHIVAISPIQGAVMNIATSTNGGAPDLTGIAADVLDAGSGLYWGERQSSIPGDSYTWNGPTFNTVAAALAAVQISYTTYIKLNPGYAVACLASWYSPGGVNLISPVLISTVPEATVISSNGSTPDTNLETFDFLYQGARFYMSLIANNTTEMESSAQAADLRQFGAAMPSKVFSLIASEDFSNIIVANAPDPYENEAGASEEEGGDGEDQEDDPVEEETLPVPSVAGHGFCTIYVPSSQELGQMAAYLWSGAFDVTQVIKLFSNPMDSILGLSAVPVSLSGTSEQIYLGGVALTGITMPKYTGRTSVKVDFGTTTINERWGSYLDYEPYTEFSIYLPFIGIKPLKADDIMGKTISLMYNIDILSGGCVAYIRAAGGSVLYEWSGQCALQIPVTARNYDNVFQTAMSVVGAVGAAVVAPASAPVLSGAVASAAVQAAATKPRIERSGTVNGITGFLGQLRPYILRTIPEAFIPADQNKFIGYPAYINVALSEVRGYNEVDSIHLENVTATGAELEEIESILKGGVIF